MQSREPVLLEERERLCKLCNVFHTCNEVNNGDSRARIVIKPHHPALACKEGDENVLVEEDAREGASLVTRPRVGKTWRTRGFARELYEFRKKTHFCVEHALLVVRAPRPALFPQALLVVCVCLRKASSKGSSLSDSHARHTLVRVPTGSRNKDDVQRFLHPTGAGRRTRDADHKPQSRRLRLHQPGPTAALRAEHGGQLADVDATWWRRRRQCATAGCSDLECAAASWQGTNAAAVSARARGGAHARP